MYEDATHTKQHFHRFGEKGKYFSYLITNSINRKRYTLREKN